MSSERRSERSGTPSEEASALPEFESLNVGSPTMDLTAEEVKRLAVPASLAFDRISAAWKLTEEQRRGLMEPGMEASVEGLRRVSLLMQIHTYLHTLLPASADGWVHRPNSNAHFGGRTAFELMASEGLQGMILVRDHLGGWAEGQ